MIEQSILIGVIVAVSKLLTNSGVNKKYIPYVNVLLGVVFSVLYSTDIQIKIAVFNGLIYGLTASGLYDLTKIKK